MTKSIDSLPVFCTKSCPLSLDSTRRHIELLMQFLQNYEWLTDAYLSDYFLLDHSKHMKPTWWTCLKRMDLLELATFLKPDHWRASEVWPLSLLAFRANVHCLPLARTPREPTKYVAKLRHTPPRTYSPDMEKDASCNKERNGHTVEPLEDGCTDGVQAPGVDIQDGQYLLLEHCYRRHVKPKKQHEISVLAKAVYALAACVPCTHVVDVGAGQGHLSRLLSFGYGLHVTTIEAAGCHAPKATKFDGEVKRDISRGQCISKKRRKKLDDKSTPDEHEVTVRDGPNPSHMVAWIGADISVTAFLTSVRIAQHQQMACPGKNDHNSITQAHHLQGQDIATSNQDLHRNSYANGNLDRKSIGLHSNGLMSKGDISTAECAIVGEMPPVANIVGLVEDNMIGYGLSGGAEQCVQPERLAGDSEGPPFVLTGLHACGDLTPTMLRVFVSCPQARGLAAVSCCYMKMDIHEAERDDREVGYPLSQSVLSLGGHPLSWEAREMACHFIDAYYNRLIEAHRDSDGQSMAHLRTHCYRAALQEIIMEKDSSVQHGSIKLTLKKAHRLPFKEYAEKALGRLGLDPCLTSTQVCVAQGRVDQWREVVAFYVLRLSLAPLIESLLLLDRIMYLAENGVSATLVPVFDPSLSPRNFVLLAVK